MQQTTELDGNGACPTCHPAHYGHPFGYCLALCLSQERGSSGRRCIELCMSAVGNSAAAKHQNRGCFQSRVYAAAETCSSFVPALELTVCSALPRCSVYVFVCVTQASSVLTAGCPATTAPSSPSGLSMVSACVEIRGTFASSCTRVPAKGCAIYTYSLLLPRRQLVARWHPLRPSDVRGGRGHPLLSFGRALLCKRWRDEQSSYGSYPILILAYCLG